ncbi:MAG: hypothetical protein IPM29_07250 [Planctomycetes bacterium]|nr:hypothetical protein [Planctomycetota bacterium]
MTTPTRTAASVSLLAVLMALAAPAAAQKQARAAHDRLLAEARVVVARFLAPGADHDELSRELRPSAAERASVLVDTAVSAEPAGAMPVVRPAPGETSLRLWAATVDELRAGTGDAARFSPGFRACASRLAPGFSWVRFEFAAPGSASGTAYEGLVRVAGRWCLIPPAGPVRAAAAEPRAAFELGHQLVLASVLIANGARGGPVDRVVGRAAGAAAELGVTLPEFCRPTGDRVDDAVACLRFVLDGAGPVLRRTIARDHGERCAQLFELATHSGLYALIYVQGSERSDLEDRLRRMVESAGAAAGVPERLWRPLLDAAERDETYERVRDLTLELGSEVGGWLQEDGRAGRPDDATLVVRGAAWKMGTDVALAALLAGRGGDPSSLLERAGRVARIVAGSEVPELVDQHGKSVTDLARALNYVLATGGRELGERIAARAGVEAAAAFELGTRMQLLLVLYAGEFTDTARAIHSACERAGLRSGLPEDLWRPALALVAAERPASEVNAELRAIHERGERWFADLRPTGR